jgi:hypothetical protein
MEVSLGVIAIFILAVVVVQGRSIVLLSNGTADNGLRQHFLNNYTFLYRRRSGHFWR